MKVNLYVLEKWYSIVQCAEPCISVDEGRDRILISDSNQHRIILSNSHGIILDYATIASYYLELWFYLYDHKVYIHAELWIAIFLHFADWIFRELWGLRVWVSQILAPTFSILACCRRLSIYCGFRGIILSRLPSPVIFLLFRSPSYFSTQLWYVCIF